MLYRRHHCNNFKMMRRLSPNFFLENIAHDLAFWCAKLRNHGLKSDGTRQPKKMKLWKAIFWRRNFQTKIKITMFVIWGDVLHLLLHQDAHSLLTCYYVPELGRDEDDAGGIGLDHNRPIANSIGPIPALKVGLKVAWLWQHQTEAQSSPYWLPQVDSTPILYLGLISAQF